MKAVPSANRAPALRPPESERKLLERACPRFRAPWTRCSCSQAIWVHDSLKDCTTYGTYTQEGSSASNRQKIYFARQDQAERSHIVWRDPRREDDAAIENRGCITGYAAVTRIRAALRERGFRRMSISTSRSSAVRKFISLSTENPSK